MPPINGTPQNNTEETRKFYWTPAPEPAKETPKDPHAIPSNYWPPTNPFTEKRQPKHIRILYWPPTCGGKMCALWKQVRDKL